MDVPRIFFINVQLNKIETVAYLAFIGPDILKADINVLREMLISTIVPCQMISFLEFEDLI